MRLKRAQLVLSLGKLAEARREALQILNRSPSVSDALVLLSETVRDLDEIRAADQFLQKFTEKNTVAFHIASANLNLMLGDTAKAQVAVQQQVQLQPEQVRVRLRPGLLFCRRLKPGLSRQRLKTCSLRTSVFSKISE